MLSPDAGGDVFQCEQVRSRQGHQDSRYNF
jgi:hypothetical protein